MAASILAELPSIADDLEPRLGTTLPRQVPLPSIDTDMGQLKDSLLSSVPDVSRSLQLPDLSGAPSAGGFKRALEEPLSKVTSVSGSSLLAGVRNAAPVPMEPASFDVNGIASQITGQVMPGLAPAPVKADVSLPEGLGGGDFTGPLRRLAEAGAATPLRLLRAMLTILDRFIATATDADQLKQFTVEALQEILIAQSRTLRDRLPRASLEAATAPLEGDFLQRYTTLLDQLAKVQGSAGPEMLAAVKAVRDELVVPIRRFEAAAVTLRQLKTSNTAPLRTALLQVVDFATADEVYLQGVFTEVETRVHQVLQAITAPVQQLTAMIQQIRQFLEQAADKADQAARQVAKQVEDTLRGIETQLQTAQTQIQRIAQEVEDFVKKVDIGPAIESFKQGCNQVVDGVERFFTEVERARKQLDDAVVQLRDQVGAQVRNGLNQLETQIRQLLDNIVGLLDRAEVKEVLDQAKQGIEKLKQAIDQASLQAVFDVVVDKTGQLEGKIQALDTTKLGTPQKTALKVGVKVIQQVKVDEVIRPELEDAFKQILEPLRELIGLLRDKVLVIEQQIDAFNPGTLVTDLIAPYLNEVFRALDSFRPSQLLEPIKEALTRLSEIVEQLDPQRLLDQVQGLYQRLDQLVVALEPTPLTKMISDAAGTATGQLVQVRDVHLDQIVNTIRETISLQKLLEGTGIQEIADAEFWELLRKTLGGEHLGLIVEAVDKVKKDLDASFSGLDYKQSAAEIKAASDAVAAQIAYRGDAYLAALGALRTLAAAKRADVEKLEQRREGLVGAVPQRPEVSAVLREIDLQPLLDLMTALDETADLTLDQATTGLAAVETVLKERSADLAKIKETGIRKAVPAIFETQFAGPVRHLVASIQDDLKPFADAIKEIQTFLRTTLTELPKRIDKTISDLLDSLKASLQGVLNEVIAAIETVRRALVDTINAVYRQVKQQVEKLNPTLVLNSFVANDFYGTAAGAPPQGLVAVATAIAGASDEVAALLMQKLPPAERELVESQSGTYDRSVMNVLNAALLDDALAKSHVSTARAKLDRDRAEYERVLQSAKGDEWVNARKKLLRNLALGRELEKVRQAYQAGSAAPARIRLNRIIIEAQYPDAVKMGLQELHPFVVEQIANLYPAETVKRIDDFYVEMVGEFKALPDRMIKKPLDEAFAKVKGKLKDTFDIQGLFRVLDVKMDGMEGDLSQGLDRLSVAYNGLLTTLDTRLSG